VRVQGGLLLAPEIHIQFSREIVRDRNTHTIFFREIGREFFYLSRANTILNIQFSLKKNWRSKTVEEAKGLKLKC